MRRWGMMGVMVAVVVAGGCSSDDTDSTRVTNPADTTDSTTITEPRDHPLDLTSDEICEIVTADDVADVLGVELDEVVPIEEGTPQCSYQFRRDTGAITNAIVNVPTVVVDLGGRTGAEAYGYVLERNRHPNFTETSLDIGEQGMMFSSDIDAEAGIHLGVVQIGDQVMITIVSVDVVDFVDAVALTELATDALRR